MAHTSAIMVRVVVDIANFQLFWQVPVMNRARWKLIPRTYR